MSEVIEEVYEFISKTSFLIKINRTIPRLTDADLHYKTDTGRMSYGYDIYIDGENSEYNYSQKMRELIDSFRGLIYSNPVLNSLGNKALRYLKTIDKIISEDYLKMNLEDFEKQYERKIGFSGMTEGKIFTSPNIFVKFENGNALNVDDELDTLKILLQRKLSFVKEILNILNHVLVESIKKPDHLAISSFRLRDKLLLKTDNFSRFRDELTENEYMEDTDLRIFKKAFSGELISEKINWFKKISSLKYLILKLIENGIIVKGDHYKEASNVFLLNGKPISNNQISRSHTLTSLSRTKVIDNAINHLNLV